MGNDKTQAPELTLLCDLGHTRAIWKQFSFVEKEKDSLSAPECQAFVILAHRSPFLLSQWPLVVCILIQFFGLQSQLRIFLWEVPSNTVSYC